MSPRWQARWRVYWPLLLLLTIPLVLQLPALLGNFSPDPMYFVAAVGDAGRNHAGYPWIDPNVGFQAQALGRLSADQWLAGQIPWWNPYNGVGLPLAAEAQPGSLFLPFVLLLHFRSGGMWLELLLQIIAGGCSFALLRKLGLSSLAAFAGALLFELNGTFAWHGAPITSPVAFLPMLVLGVEILRSRVMEQASGGWWLIPVALAWSVYAGFPEIAYIDGLFAGVWVLARCGGMDRQQTWRFIRRLCVAVAVGVLLCLPLIVPMVEYIGRAYIGGHDAAFGHASLPRTAPALSLMPWLYGPISAFNDPASMVAATWGNIGGYFTALQFFMAAVGVFFCRRQLYFYLLAWMLLCLAKTFDLWLVTDLINLVPLIKSAAFYRYAPASWEFAGCVLVAMCVDGMQRGEAVATRRLLAMFVLVCSAVAMAIWLARPATHALAHVESYRIYFRVACVWLFLSLSGALALVSLQRWRHAPLALVILLSLDACLAFALPIRSGVRHLSDNEPGVAFLRQHLGLQRFYSLGPLAPNYGAYFKVAQINHNYLPVSRDWVDHVQTRLDPSADRIIFNGSFGGAGKNHEAIQALKKNLASYEALGVRYVVAPAGSDPFAETQAPAGDAAAAKSSEARRVYQGTDMSIYELPDASPYFETAGGACRLQVINRSALISHCPAPSQLIRREAFYPGWHVEVDEATWPIQRADELFQAVNLPAGTHRVVFHYEPTHAGWILGGFLAGIAALLATVLAEFKRRRSAQLAGSSSSTITIASSRPSRAG
jgi:hypothetical protein